VLESDRSKATARDFTRSCLFMLNYVGVS
jgi:hypothetical protein